MIFDQISLSSHVYHNTLTTRNCVPMLLPKPSHLWCIHVWLIAYTSYSFCRWFWLLLYAAITIPFAPFVVQPIKFFRCCPGQQWGLFARIFFCNVK